MTHPPITPPSELMEKRYAEADDLVGIATRRAARWAADQEMEAWINDFHAYDSSRGEDSELITGLRADRRPKPPSLAEQALEAPKEPTTEDKKPLSLVYNCHMKGMPPNPHQDWQSYFAHCAATGIISGLRFEAIQPTPSINDTTLPETTMTNPTPLSPAAQAVLDAFDAAALDYPNFRVEPMIAAAIRAAADQITPAYFQYNSGNATNQGIDFELGQERRNEEIRAALLAIAAELEQADD